MRRTVAPSSRPTDDGVLKLQGGGAQCFAGPGIADRHGVALN